MGHIQIALQRIAAVFLQQRCNVCPVLGRFAALQKIRQVRIAERPLRGVPKIFLCSGFHVFVLLAMKCKPDGILVQQEIVHHEAPFGQKMLLYPYYGMDILLAKVVFGTESFLRMVGTSPRKLLLGRAEPQTLQGTSTAT